VVTVNIKGGTNLLVTDRETSSSDPLCMIWVGQYSASELERAKRRKVSETLPLHTNVHLHLYQYQY